MSESIKLCPICQAQNHRDAKLCSTCGTTIADVPLHTQSDQRRIFWKQYDFRHGETDLFEGSVRFRGRLLTILALIVIILAALAATLTVMRSLMEGGQFAAANASPSARPRRPLLPTVTTGPPTATFTLSPVPTMVPSETNSPQPCLHRVAAGDSLIGIISRCGHSSLDILPTVKAINGIADETRIQVGQEIVVPWPSPTFDPAATALPTIESAARFDDDSAAGDISLLSFDPFAPTAPATLLPGLMWHTVATAEHMILIALQYDTDAKALSDLNPEIEFNLCDFGLRYGGAECLVFLSQGQKMRVPAPTPTRTPFPTPSGDETPSPLPTTTKNTPHAFSPANQSFFGSLDQITLRWVATGALETEEVYRIAVSDIATGTTYNADTRDLYFIIPVQWQAEDDQRHTYIWQVSIMNPNSGRSALATEPMTLVWHGAGGGN